MRRRLLVVIALVLGVATAAMAADPIIGSWKLNIAKSKFASNGPPAPKEQTEVYREPNPGQIELTYKSTEKDGSSYQLILGWPAQGGTVKVLQGDPRGTSWVEALIAGEWYAMYLRDGTQFASRHKVVSKDGKTLRQMFRSVDEQGKPYELLLVFDRQ
jgi:hypothetical protein